MSDCWKIDEATPGGSYDPARHGSQIVAVFADPAAGERARAALLDTGVPAHAMDMLAGDADERSTEAIEVLFVPPPDMDDYRHALRRGYALVVVWPDSVTQRDSAVDALERCHPLDVDAHVREWRNPPSEQHAPSWNHANVSRADMHGRALRGYDKTMRDMTGRKMTVRVMSQQDMAEAPYRPFAASVDRPTSPSPRFGPAQTASVTGVTYTHGVPPVLVARLSPEQQIAAQAPAPDLPTARQFVRVGADQPIVGWRDRPGAARRVRSYVAERAAGPNPARFRQQSTSGGIGESDVERS